MAHSEIGDSPDVPPRIYQAAEMQGNFPSVPSLRGLQVNRFFILFRPNSLELPCLVLHREVQTRRELVVLLDQRNFAAVEDVRMRAVENKAFYKTVIALIEEKVERIVGGRVDDKVRKIVLSNDEVRFEEHDVPFIPITIPEHPNRCYHVRWRSILRVIYPWGIWIGGTFSDRYCFSAKSSQYYRILLTVCY